MKEYTFKIIRQVDIVIPAESEDQAWAQIATINPEQMAPEWTIDLIKTPQTQAEARADSTEPCEEDDFGGEFMDYLNPTI